MTTTAGRAGAALPPESVGSMTSLAEIECCARSVLPPEVWDFIAGGAGEELTLAANRSALDRTWLVPRVLTDVSARGCATRLLDDPAAMPVAVAPMAFQRLVHPDGELAVAQAAKAAGIPFVAS